MYHDDRTLIDVTDFYRLNYLKDMAVLVLILISVLDRNTNL